MTLVPLRVHPHQVPAAVEFLAVERSPHAAEAFASAGNHLGTRPLITITPVSRLAHGG